MEIEFANRTVVVAGAGRGIGHRIVQAFAARGARLWVCDLLEPELAELARNTPLARGASIATRVADVTKPEQVDAFIREAEAGRSIDVLVYVAGGVRGQRPRPIEEVPLADWLAIYESNVVGAFNFAHAVAPAMKRARQGRIVVISSRAGLAVSLTGIQSYASAKAAQIGLVRQLASELGPHGITVNSVAPGFMPTSPDYVRQWESYGEDGQRRLVERIAMRRLGTPEDIAHAVLFFASPFAGWITGQVLQVTGGP